MSMCLRRLRPRGFFAHVDCTERASDARSSFEKNTGVNALPAPAMGICEAFIWFQIAPLLRSTTFAKLLLVRLSYVHPPKGEDANLSGDVNARCMQSVDNSTGILGLTDTPLLHA